MHLIFCLDPSIIKQYAMIKAIENGIRSILLTAKYSAYSTAPDPVI